MVNLGFISFDILLIIIALAILIGVSFKSGKKVVIGLTLSIYPALLITQYLPFLSLTDATAEAVVFILIYILSAVILWKNFHVRKIHSGGRKILDYSLVSISYLILFLSVWFNGIPSLQFIHSFEPQIVNLIQSIPFGVSLILPLIILIITNRHDRH